MRKVIGQIILSAIFITTGSLHFLMPQLYLKIMPPYLPVPLVLIYISGAAEILGGIGLFIPNARRAAAWGLIALLVAVMPANIYMATAHIPFPGIMGQSWAQWARLPLQVPLIYWAWLYTRSRREFRKEPAC
jgi:uncharacterized membrane protein